jgi:group I intron endonuclease
VDALLAQILAGVARELRMEGTGKRKKDPMIYMLTSPSGKAYVGQTINPTQRMHKHASGKSHCTALAAAIQKHGWHNFKMQVLVRCAEECLDEMECQMIEKHNTLHPNGYNLIPGGGFNPIKDPATYAKVRGMWDRGEIQELQRASWTPQLRERMSKVHKERCLNDGGRQASQGTKNLVAGGATAASNSDEAKARRASSWDKKRAERLASLSPGKAKKVLDQTKRKKTSYQEACAKAGGADKLREKRREWARKRKERAFLANS